MIFFLSKSKRGCHLDSFIIHSDMVAMVTQFIQICLITVFMVAMVRGTAYSFGEFLKDIEDEFCNDSCEKLLGWIESLSIGELRVMID